MYYRNRLQLNLMRMFDLLMPLFSVETCVSFLPTVLLVIACMILHENVISTRCNAGLTINPKLQPFYKRKTPYCQVHSIVYTKLRITLIMCKKNLTPISVYTVYARLLHTNRKLHCPSSVRPSM